MVMPIKVAAALAALIIFLFFCYFPGLSGDFLLDDYHVLEPLAVNGGIDNVQKLFNYIFSSTTGPLGRPLSLLTFSLNASNWPADPFPFLVTNVVIHCFNVVLVVFFVSLLLRSAEPEKKTEAFLLAFVCGLFWGLHPMQVSSVLYVVQRMTLLSGMFSLLAFIFYLMARWKANECKWSATCINLFGCGFACVLALLSKENAVLIPLQLMMIEVYIRITRPNSVKLVEHVTNILLLLGVAVIAGYLLYYFATDLLGHRNRSVGREFSMHERVLTEFRVLGDYVYDLVIPKMQSAGVYHDNYQVSENIFAPISTLFWFVLHCIAIALAVAFRRRFGFIFFGVLWFYSCHLIESTVIMLELKFEHRNYLASIGIVLMMVMGLHRLSSNRSRFLMAVAVVFCVYASMLFGATSLWGEPLKAAIVWTEENPGSARALENAASKSLAHGGEPTAIKRYMRRLVEVQPSATSELKYILAFCETYDGAPPNWSALAEGIRDDPRNWSLHRVLVDLLTAKSNESCDLLSYRDFFPLAAAYKENPVYMGQKSIQLIEEAEYTAALLLGDLQIVEQVELRYDLHRTPLALTTHRAGLLATYGFLELANMRLAAAINIAREHNSVGVDHLEEARGVLKAIGNELKKEEK